MLDEPFKKLEEKVKKTADAVRNLRKENETLKRALNQPGTSRGKRSGREGKEVAQLRKAHTGLEKELSSLQKERTTVRTRVAGLLRQLDALDLD